MSNSSITSLVVGFSRQDVATGGGERVVRPVCSGPAAVPYDESFQLAVNVAYSLSEWKEILKDTDAKRETDWVEKKLRF